VSAAVPCIAFANANADDSRLLVGAANKADILAFSGQSPVGFAERRRGERRLLKNNVTAQIRATPMFTSRGDTQVKRAVHQATSTLNTFSGAGGFVRCGRPVR